MIFWMVKRGSLVI